METTKLDDLIVRTFLEETFLKKTFALAIVAQSGAGKGTLARGIIESAGRVNARIHVSETGAHFRREIPNLAPWAKEQLAYIQNAGRLQSAGIAASLWMRNLLYDWEGLMKGSVIFDGSPRSHLEALILTDFVTNFLRRKLLVIHLKIDDDLAEERLLKRLREEEVTSGPRPEVQDPEARKRKLAYYHEHIVPMMDVVKTLPNVIIEDIEVRRQTTQEEVLLRALNFCRGCAGSGEMVLSDEQ